MNYTVVICGIIGFLIVFVQVLYQMYKDGEFSFFYIALSLFFGGVGCVAGFIISWMLPLSYKTESFGRDIETLKDNSSIHGSFFLGTGSVNGTMNYVCYIKDGPESFHLFQAPYHKSSIEYTAGPTIIWITDKRPDENYFWNRFAFDLIREDDQTYVFHIPKGSIQNNFKLDAE